MTILSGLQGKVAVVTGAGRMRSIGRSLAIGFARAGCDVALTGTGRPIEQYPDDEKAVGWRDIESVADEIRALGVRALPVVSDVSSADAVEELADRIEAEFGRIDFVINNAGSVRGNDRAPVAKLPLEVWHRVVNINLNGTFYMSRTFAQRLIGQGRGGAIVNISTVGTKLLPPNAAAYACSKSAINALSTIMAGELGEHDIRVNAICPGLIDTSRMDNIPKGEVWDALVKTHIPLGRAGTGEDIANMAVFLCSDQGAWITAQHIYVDGGHGHTTRY